MPDTFKIVKARNAGEKQNPHGGTLVKWYILLTNAPSGEDEVYVQKKPGNDLSAGMEITGRLEKGEYGWRLFPDAQQGGQSRGNGPPSYPVPTLERQDDRSRRIERQHSQEMALRALRLVHGEGQEASPSVDWRSMIADWTDWFVQDLDVDVGGGTERPAVSEGASGFPPAAADVSAAPYPQQGGLVNEEASPQQKGRLTQEFNKAGFSRDAMKAVVLYRCHSEKATKQGASQLIDDLQGGATLEQLLAEIWDGKRAGNPLAIRAAALIPSEVPGDTDGLPELSDEDKAKYGSEKDIPF